MKPPSRYPGFWRPAHLVQRRIESLGFEPKHEWLATNLGKELGTIDHETLPPCGTQVTSQGGFELLCSYNWHRRTSWRAQPEIHVPGEAPGLRLQKVPLKTRLMGMGKGKKPKKKSYRDVNSAQSPLSPFEPMFRAVGVMRPAYRFDDVDVVVNRSSLHHLLRLGRLISLSLANLKRNLFFFFFPKKYPILLAIQLTSNRLFSKILSRWG